MRTYGDHTSHMRYLLLKKINLLEEIKTHIMDFVLPVVIIDNCSILAELTIKAGPDKYLEWKDLGSYVIQTPNNETKIPGDIVRSMHKVDELEKIVVDRFGKSCHWNFLAKTSGALTPVFKSLQPYIKKKVNQFRLM